MPLSFVRSGTPRVYLPGYNSANNGISMPAFRKIAQNLNDNFESGQFASLQGGRAELNAQDIVAAGIKFPAYAFEAPLRPLDAATGGGLTQYFNEKGKFIHDTPIVGNIIDGIGSLFSASQMTGNAFVNYPLAEGLKQAIGKADDFKIGGVDDPWLGLFGGQTAGQIRREALARWGADENGKTYTLADLEQRASQNPWDFGHFATHENGITNFLMQAAFNPLNLLFFAGAAADSVRGGVQVIGSGIKFLEGWSRAEQWAKPVLSIPGAVRASRGYGYMQSVGRGIATAARPVGEFYAEMHTPTPQWRKFLDVGSAATDNLEGNFIRSGYMRSLFTSQSYLARGARIFQKAYFPGINPELTGARLAGSAARAWMRGGLQQEAAGIAGEYLFGSVDNYLQENNMDHNVIGGTVNWIHDTLTKINNSHPLSDHDAFVMAAMFMPSFGIAREGITKTPVNILRRSTEDLHINRVEAQLREKTRKQFGNEFKNWEDTFKYLGDGDLERGKKVFEFLVEHMEIRKVENQLAHLTHLAADAEVDGLAQRLAYMSQTVRENLIRRRRTGALQPGSTADYIIEQHQTIGRPPTGESELSSQFTATANSLYDEAKRLYLIHETLGPQLRDLGLRVQKGGILDRDTLEVLIEQAKRAENIDPATVRHIIEQAPSLVYGANADVWRELSVTLGRKEAAGVPGRMVSEVEQLTKQDLITALEDLRQYVPTAADLFHETIRAAKSVGTVRKGVLTVKEPPYPMGKKLQANRLKGTGRIQQYALNDAKMTKMRNTEFAKNGEARFGTAEEVTSQGGLRYHKNPDGFYSRDDGVRVGIQDGSIRIEVPATYEADLLTQLNKTIFKSGPRKGQIKPGMEEESQRLNLKIEEARMGMDQDALLTAIQHGGRVIVTSPLAGPWLARHGFLESARIEHRYPTWIDPGEKPPEPGFPSDINEGKMPPQPGDNITVKKVTGGTGDVEEFRVVNQGEDGVYTVEDVDGNMELIDPSEIIDSTSGWKAPPLYDAEWREWNEKRSAWKDAMIKGVQTGVITKEEALARGLLMDEMWGFKDLPDTLYHATTHTRGVRNKGMMTSGELADQGKRVGLGGTPSYVNSFTTSPAVAQRIADVLVEAGKYLRGEISTKDLAAIAKRDGFYEDFRYAVGSKMLERAEKEKWTGTQTVPGKYDEFDSVSEWVDREVQLSPDEILAEKDFIYKKFLDTQDRHFGAKREGGPVDKLDPVLVNSDFADPLRDVKSRMNTMPEDISVVRAHPIRKGAQGYNDLSERYLHEWKVIPEAISIEGISDAAAYSFRGGNPMAVLENSKQGVFRAYRPSRRIERSEAAAIGVARGDARKNSLLHPTDWSVGPAMTPDNNMFPEERRRALKEYIRSTRGRYKQELKYVSELDDFAQSMFPFDKKIRDMGLQDWADPLTGPEYQKVKEFFEMASQFPDVSFTREPTVLVDPAESRVMTFQTVLNRRQKMLMDYGPLAPIQRFYDAVLAPKAQRYLGKQAQDEVHNLLTVAGWSPNMTREFMAKLRKEVLDSREVVGLGKLIGSHKYSSVQAIEEEKIRAIARDIAPAETANVIDRYGSFQKMFTQAGNRLLRTAARARRSGVKLSPMAAAADAAYRVWQYAPVFKAISGVTQRFTKYTYPLLRFRADPLFVMMNYTEPYVYNILNNGWRGLKLAQKGVPAESKRLLELASKGNIPPGGLFSENTPIDLLLADPGFYTLPTNIRPNLEAEFHLTSQKMAEEIFRAMGPEHPIAQMMRERFGDSVKDWAAEWNKTMATLAHKGPEFLTRKAFKDTLEKELGFTQAELKQLTPITEALTERYRGLAHDLADLYVGRMNRSNLERFANNFFVAWPVSYMIKVTGWAYKVLFEKLGPVHGNAGAYLWNEYRKQYEKLLQNDSDFANWAEENPDFLFAVEMLMPVTPVSIGASLNKTTRYVGNWITQQALDDPSAAPFGDYTPDSVPALLESSFRFGPFRTYNLVKNSLKSFGVPGFYEEPKGNQIPQYP